VAGRVVEVVRNLRELSSDYEMARRGHEMKKA
jgi:hypothetical protein